MKFNELIDHLDSKPKKPESMTLQKFLSMLSPSEKAELKKAEKESRDKSDPKNRKAVDVHEVGVVDDGDELFAFGMGFLMWEMCL